MSSSSSSPTAQWRVLLAEDNAINRHRTVRILGQLHCATDTAEEQDSVRTLLLGQAYDVVLLNWQMQAIDPLSLVAELRADDRQSNLRIVGLVPPNDTAARQAFLNAGVQTVLTKPLHLETLRPLFEEQTQEPDPQLSTNDTQATIHAQLQTLDGDSPAFMLDVLNSFMKNTPGLLREMHASLSNKDIERILRAAHTLKASAQMVGLTHLSALAKATEMAARAQQPMETLIHYVGQVAMQYKVVRPALLAERAVLETLINANAPDA